MWFESQATTRLRGFVSERKLQIKVHFLGETGATKQLEVIKSDKDMI